MLPPPLTLQGNPLGIAIRIKIRVTLTPYRYCNISNLLTESLCLMQPVLQLAPIEDLIMLWPRVTLWGNPSRRG